jgi:hypothetical protein
MSHPDHANHQLLFGLLALQNGIINQGQVVAAFQAWTLDKTRGLADHLEARGELTSTKRAVLEALAAVHLEAHDGDVEHSLADVPSSRSTRASLASLGNPEALATLARIARSKNGPVSEPGDDDENRVPSRPSTDSATGPTSGCCCSTCRSRKSRSRGAANGPALTKTVLDNWRNYENNPSGRCEHERLPR